MHKYGALILGIVGLFTLLTGWLKMQVQPPSTPTTATPGKTAYYLQNFKTHVIQENGLPQYRLTGHSLTYQPTDDSIEIIKPNIELLENKQPVWQITAEKARGQESLDEISLVKNVKIIHHSGDPKNPIALITTETLRLNPRAARAETTQKAVITTEKTTIIAAGGFTADTKTQRINLIDVQAHYAVTH